MPLRVVYGTHHHPRPEPLAILAHAPPFILGAADATRARELVPRLAGLDVRLDEKAGEMLADDLFPAVALDSLGAGVPARHDAFRVEHVDRVVHHAFHQEAEALLGLPQGLLVELALGNVARDLGKAQQLAGIVAQRCDHYARPKARAVLAHA